MLPPHLISVAAVATPPREFRMFNCTTFSFLIGRELSVIRYFCFSAINLEVFYSVDWIYF